MLVVTLLPYPAPQRTRSARPANSIVATLLRAVMLLVTLWAAA
jgi:hypothetical protein